MALDSTKATALNKMCKVAQSATLGTEILAMQALLKASGVATAVAGDDTAGYKDIATGLTAITGFIVQVFRAGVNVLADGVVTATAGTLRVADGSATFALTAGDKINYMVW